MCDALPPTLWAPWAPRGARGPGASHFTPLLDDFWASGQTREKGHKNGASCAKPFLMATVIVLQCNLDYTITLRGSSQLSVVAIDR